MRLTLDGQRLYDYIVADLEKSDVELNIPVIDRVMTYKEYLNIEHVYLSLTQRQVVSIKRAMDKLVKELSREMMVFAIYEHFLSIPPGMDRMFIKIIDDLFIPLRDNRGEVTDSAQAIGFHTLSDSLAEAAYMLEVHNLDRWAIVEFDFLNVTCVLTVGRNLKDHLFEVKYGRGRWKGEQFFPDGSSDADDTDPNELENDLLQTVRGLTVKNDKSKHRQRAATIRHNARRARRRR